jgi:hypothetical protein
MSRADVCSLGDPPIAPEVSIVVPLLRRVDLIEHQLAQFAADPELAECELIYVVADPEQAELAREIVTELYALYGLPLRLLALTAPGDRPLACQLGAASARAQRLLFLGSDVIPQHPGWVGHLTAALDAEPAVAAAAPTLLDADGEIARAGSSPACLLVDAAAEGGELAHVHEAELFRLEGLGAEPVEAGG